MSKRICRLGWSLALVLCCAPAYTVEPSSPDIKLLMSKFIQRSHEEDTERLDKNYGYVEHRITEEFDQSGSLLQHREETFQLLLINGSPLERLIAAGALPLPADSGSAGKLRKPQQQLDLRLDDKFVSHFQVSLVGSEQLNGRRSYIFAMIPKPSDIPVRSNNEQVFVHMRRKVWVDADDYSMAKCDLTLTQRTYFYVVLGCVRKLDLLIQRRCVDAKVWLPERVSYYLDYRELLKNTREKKDSSYREFRKFAN